MAVCASLQQGTVLAYGKVIKGPWIQDGHKLATVGWGDGKRFTGRVISTRECDDDGDGKIAPASG